MKFEHTQTFNFENALRGMRNPLESWSRSDSYYNNGEYIIGPNDMNLAQRLIRGGSTHRKFLRQIFVSVDITAPMYWWSEADTYSVGTSKNSTSKMHKLASTLITLECFETDDLSPELSEKLAPVINSLLAFLEALRQQYNQTKDERYWKELIRWLPESWLQTRTVTLNYENLINIVHQRRGHKLTEWQQFIDWAHLLPYASELIFYDELGKKCEDVVVEGNVKKKVLEESDSIFEAVDNYREAKCSDTE